MINLNQNLGILANLFRKNQPTIPSAVNPGLQSPYPQQALPEQDFSFLEELRNSIRNPPVREDPSILRRIGGVIAGLGAGVQPVGTHGGQPFGFQGNPLAAMEVSDRFTHAPYYKEKEEYDEKLSRLSKGAELESDRITQDRLLKREESLAADRAERAELTRQLRAIQEGDAETRRMNAETSRLRQQIQEWALRNPEDDIKIIGNQVVATNPRTKESQVVFTSDSELTDSARLELQHALRMRELAFGQEGRKELEGMRQDRSTNEMSPTQVRADEYNQARKIVNDNPHLEAIIEFLPNNIVRLKEAKQTFGEKASSLVRGTSTNAQQDLRDEAIKLMPFLVSSNQQQQTLTRKVRNRNTGEERTQISTDGGKTWSFE